MTKVNNYVEVYSDPEWVRTFVCGDLHGQYKILMKALDEIGFNFESDMLICTGDLVDHGEQNLEIIALLDEPWFKSVRGNHDQMCISGLTNTKMRQSHKDKENGGAWFYGLSDSVQQSIFERFSDLPYAIEVHQYGHKFAIMHGELSLNNWEQFKSKFTESVDTDELNAFTDTIIWERDRIETKGSLPYKRVEGVDFVFFGHTIVDKVTVTNDNCIFIDTGAYKTGDLSFAIFSGVTAPKIKTVKGKKPK